jgi:hypothetical protein
MLSVIDLLLSVITLAAEYEFDREAYTEAKGPFVERILLQLRGRRGAS